MTASARWPVRGQDLSLRGQWHRSVSLPGLFKAPPLAQIADDYTAHCCPGTCPARCNVPVGSVARPVPASTPAPSLHLHLHGRAALAALAGERGWHSTVPEFLLRNSVASMSLPGLTPCPVGNPIALRSRPGKPRRGSPRHYSRQWLRCSPRLSNESI